MVYQSFHAVHTRWEACLCMQGILWRIGLLKHVWEEALRPQEQAREGPVTAAQLSCDLLTKLKSMLHQYSLQGGPRGE